VTLWLNNDCVSRQRYSLPYQHCSRLKYDLAYYGTADRILSCPFTRMLKAKFHYAIPVADRSETGC